MLQEVTACLSYYKPIQWLVDKRCYAIYRLVTGRELAVNRLVAGSNPARGAKQFQAFMIEDVTSKIGSVVSETTSQATFFGKTRADILAI
jgi:hypothetical protein